MPSDVSVAALHSLSYHIDLAEEFSRGLDRASFLSDLKSIYAVTRCLEIISEASRRLPPVLKARHPYIPWRAMAAAGNFYRHEYEDVAASLVWDVMTKEFEPLRLMIAAELDPQT
jgi:uncharacterized protein with HEPN domain